jgi:chromosomal replication initiation ATPase DnaA
MRKPLEILDKICDYLCVHRDGVLSKSRRSELVKARYFYIVLLNIEGYSEAEIISFTKRDRTTILHAMKQIEYRVKKDRIYKNQFFELKDLIDEHTEETFSDLLDREADMLLDLQPINYLV